MKSSIITLLSVALLAAATGCTNKGSVIGSVATEQDNRPVREARVVLVPVGGDKEYTTTADWGGNYTMHVKEGEYRISAQHPGLELCGGGNMMVEVLGNKVATVDLCLAKIEAAGTNAPVTPAAAPAPTDPAAPAASQDQPAPNSDTSPTAPTASTETAASSQPVEVTPIAPTEVAPGVAPTTASQFPPSAPPTFPPASSTSAQTN